MKHNFTDAQILAARNVVSVRKDEWEYTMNIGIRDLRSILDELPDPQPVVIDYSMAEDVWDRARYEAGLVEDSHEYADLIPEAQRLVQTALQLVVDDQINPAPVTHPDPDEHPYILVSGYDDGTDDGVLFDEPVQYLHYSSWYYSATHWPLSPGWITDWEPAKFVAKGDGRG